MFFEDYNSTIYSTSFRPSETLSFKELIEQQKADELKKAQLEAEKNKNLKTGIGGEKIEARTDGFERNEKIESHKHEHEHEHKHEHKAESDQFNAEFTRRYPKWNSFTPEQKDETLKNHLGQFKTPQTQQREVERLSKLMQGASDTQMLSSNIEHLDKSVQKKCTEVVQSNTKIAEISPQEKEILNKWENRKIELKWPPKSITDKEWLALSKEEKEALKAKGKQEYDNLATADKKLIEEVGKIYCKKALMTKIQNWNNLNFKEQGEALAKLLDEPTGNEHNAKLFMSGLVKAGVEINDPAVMESILKNVKSPQMKAMINTCIISNKNATLETTYRSLDALHYAIETDPHATFETLSNIDNKDTAELVTDNITQTTNSTDYQQAGKTFVTNGKDAMAVAFVNDITKRKDAADQVQACGTVLESGSHKLQKIATTNLPLYHKDAQKSIYSRTLTSKFDDIRKLAANNIYKLHEDNRQYAIDVTKATEDKSLISSIQSAPPKTEASTANTAAQVESQAQAAKIAAAEIVNNSTTPITKTPQEQRRAEMIKQYHDSDVVGKLKLAIDLGKESDIEKLIMTLSEPGKLKLLDQLNQFAGLEKEILNSIKRSNPSNETLALLTKVEIDLSNKNGYTNPFALRK